MNFLRYNKNNFYYYYINDFFEINVFGSYFKTNSEFDIDSKAVQCLTSGSEEYKNAGRLPFELARIVICQSKCYLKLRLIDSNKNKLKIFRRMSVSKYFLSNILL